MKIEISVVLGREDGRRRWKGLDLNFDCVFYW